MLKTLLFFVSCSLLSASALADTVNINEAGLEGSLPIVTIMNDPGSTFLKSGTATPVACINAAIVTECWRIDLVVQGQNLASWGSTYGLELSEPGTPGILSDSLGSAAAVPDFPTDTVDISFQLFSDDPSGTLGGRASVCQQKNGCVQAGEDGTFQAANQGLTVFDPASNKNNSFNLFFKSDVGDAPVDTSALPEPLSLVLLCTGLLGIAGAVRRSGSGRPAAP